ncbi:MAG TPA: di-heme oxidoredictase family protein [Candidatus Eisenbacteria bacterium]|nr:di-heme oxidoredictase family protein [Candidatus Eisenbacteria bacterium]
MNVDRAPTWRVPRWIAPGMVAGSVLLALSAGCGKLLTTAPDDGDLFDAPLPGLSPAEHAAFVEGDEQFGKAFAMSEGLGPIFNDVSCASCHSGDGRGRLENALTRFSVLGSTVPELGGPQLQDRAIPGAEAERLPAACETSLRLPPPVFGMGLMEAVPADSILLRADPGDLDGDGISGRAHFVPVPAFVPAHEPGSLAPALGRFGRKAQVSTLLQQTVDAYHQDIGITTDFRPDENLNPLASRPTHAADRVADPEIPASIVRSVVAYLRLLAPPAPGESTPRREQGRALFATAGCVSCHVPVLRTGPSPTPALAHREVALYSDLLLHDMGDGLADYRTDGDADGREWRTTPLWGLRIMREFLNGQAFLLHDGSARTVEEAILKHGGEAQAARDAFAGLPAAERAALLDFVESR